MSANIIFKRKLLMREKRLCIPVNSEKKGSSTKIAKYIFKRAFETFKSFIEIQRTCFEKTKKTRSFVSNVTIYHLWACQRYVMSLLSHLSF